MPLMSKAQGRFLNWKFGHDWVRRHHFGGSQEGLPQYVKGQQGLNQVPHPNPGLVLFRRRLLRRPMPLLAHQSFPRKPGRGMRR